MGIGVAGWLESCQGQTGIIVNFNRGNLTWMRLLKLFFKSTSSISKYHLLFSQDRDEFLCTGLKTANISEDGNFSTSGQFSLGDWWNSILCTDFFFEHFSGHHRNTGQHSGPHCTSQSVVDSSSNKNFSPLSGYDWFLCWRYCSAGFCCLFYGNC